MAGGSRIVINKQGIMISTGGKILYQAGQHIFKSGAEVAVKARVLPTFVPHEESHQFKVIDENNNPCENTEYLILDQNNQAHIGKTNKEGLTKRVFYAENTELRVFYGADAIEKMEQLGLK
ncbi:hypothetical protein [Acinetobacter seifertii]|uniref:DUF2345 domain-containing protein n=1 Tax=Acinetobacter seifertii TaxID=1530123 RepID=N8S5R9_9GAMM|nr:hypothetical protein [Acinetobacter seifertii]ENU41712.1 hypothetical protein F985_02599 [Acinetobacter seifertii]MBJ9424524.1 hypothetical protein [Acinetobacter seifertii]